MLSYERKGMIDRYTLDGFPLVEITAETITIWTHGYSERVRDMLNGILEPRGITIYDDWVGDYMGHGFTVLNGISFQRWDVEQLRQIAIAEGLL